MVSYDTLDLLTVSTVCQMCMTQLKEHEQSLIIVRWPQRNSHMLCMECWALMIAAAYAWIKGHGEDGSDRLSERLEEAWDIFQALKH